MAYIKEDMEVNEKIGLCNHGILLSLLPPIIIITVTMRIQFAVSHLFNFSIISCCIESASITPHFSSLHVRAGITCVIGAILKF